MIKISEIFGPTFQGEGPSLGRRAAFVRVGRCNLACSWCDTPYTWDWTGKNGKVYVPSEELTDMLPEAVAEQITAMKVPLLVLTGGEPMSAQRSLLPLVKILAGESDMEFEIETNGTISPMEEFEYYIDQFNVSPKLANSNQPRENRIKWDALKDLNETGRAVFKFVVTGPDDMEEIDEIVQHVGIAPDKVWVMGEGRSANDIEGHADTVIVDVLERGWNLTTRLHVLLWGDRRGV